MDALQILIDATEGSLDVAEPFTAAQVLMLARTLVDHSLAGRKARPSVRFSQDGIEVTYQPDHLITRLEDATARLNELAPGDEGDTPRLEAAIERVADLLEEVRSQRDREVHIRNWVLHGLRQIEDLTDTPLGREVLISADAVRRIIAETREQAYQGEALPPSGVLYQGGDLRAEVERIAAERDEVLRKVDEAVALLAEMQGALSKVQRERDTLRDRVELLIIERDESVAAQAGQSEAIRHLSDELRAVRRERDQVQADFASFRAFQFGNDDGPAS